MKILLTVYKIQAGLGSEDGCGYEIAKRICANYSNITLISRKNNIELLKPDPAFQKACLIGHDVEFNPIPKFLRFPKTHYLGIIPYYYRWQYEVGQKVRQLQQNQRFDIIHNLNFHTDWAPHFLRNPKGKLVWGPILHHEKVPASICHPYLSGNLAEILKNAAKYFFWCLDPAIKRALKATDHIIYGNSHYAPRFKKHLEKITAFPYAGVSLKGLDSLEAANSSVFRCLFVARLTQIKGLVVALEAFMQFKKKLGAENQQKIRLTIVGKGPLENFLSNFIASHKLQNIIQLIDWMDQQRLTDYYAQSDIFLYPSFESQGLVVAEAMAFGAVPVVFENTGPAFVAGEAACCVRRAKLRIIMIDNIAAMLSTLFDEWQTNPKAFMARKQKALQHCQQELSWDKITAKIMSLYNA